uniref:RNA helicase n=1 Tax=Salmo trutta TaxID=8032 RepID=A0A674AIC3_SALTR
TSLFLLSSLIRSLSHLKIYSNLCLSLYSPNFSSLILIWGLEGLTWQKIVQFFTQHLEKSEQQAAAQELKSILQAAKQMGIQLAGLAGMRFVIHAAVFLFETAIKQMFGPFLSSAADTSCAAVSSCRAPQRGSSFGRNITFSYDCYTLDPQEALAWAGGPEDEAPGRGLDFHSFLNNHQGLRGNGLEADGGRLSPGGAQSSGVGTILRGEVEKYLNGGNMISSSPEELCATLFEMLASTKSDDELQNELFELLGPEGFEMISVLFQRRSSVVDSLLSIPADRINYPPDVSRKGGRGEGSSKPTYSCQVTIQSEKEKEMMKMHRRKRERKRGERRWDDTESSSDLYFDPKEMTAQREQALLTARRSPVSSRERLMLPEGIKRENNKMNEEVEIPPSDPIGFEEKPIYTSELHEVGQLVFKGMQRLNRIQSIVFETAYNTNENLLISAPTGAGKTNIAMLTKDEFKIVYVAPMKALAAEMTIYFSKRLEPLGIAVKELTGDMQLTKGKILRTQMLVTTPEKWDMVTRKSVGVVALSQIVKLLILDEHCLANLPCHTHHRSMIRILGLSATLPNYLDVASFLHVSPYIGLFYFDSHFRPVPLGQSFVGIKTTNKVTTHTHTHTHTHTLLIRVSVLCVTQVMVFVHARNAMVRTAMGLIEMAKNRGESSFFQPDHLPDYGQCEKSIQRSRNKQMKEMFPDGFGIHHAGMLRADRSLMESMFSRGYLKVLCCTATLAWGVNLPAHAVIIKGTQIYDAKRGTLVDLGILDVMQIFGRAGRPQFDKYGEGTIITAHDKLSHYLTLLTQQNPIESQFLEAIVSLGTMTNVEEAVRWLSYTYLYIRMRANPLVYGINHKAYQMDPGLEMYRKELVVMAARKLDKARMIRFEERTGYFASTDLGRTASHFYIKYNTMEMFNELFNSQKTEADILSIVSKAEEFEQVKVRDEEKEELEQMLCNYCELPAAGGVENGYGKINILLQTYIGRGEVDSFSLISDLSYVAQNTARIVSALFEIALRKRWPAMTYFLLNLCKVIDKRLWGFAHPLRQFSILPHNVLARLEEKKLTVDKLKDMQRDEIGETILVQVKQCVHHIPSILIEATIQPITRTVLRVRLQITPDFKWHDQCHGSVGDPWWLWVEDPINDHIYHSEYLLLQKKQVVSGEPQQVVFTIPIFEPMPSQYYIRAVSDRWLGSEAVCIINFQHLILPERHPPHTELLDLQPLPITALGNPEYEIFNHYPTSKVVYIAPLKALNRSYVQKVAILIIDEIHLLGGDRGPVLEVIVSRTNFISSHTNKTVRVTTLSIMPNPLSRPLDMCTHASALPGHSTHHNRFACSPAKPVLIFVSSRRQTRLTALDLIAFLTTGDDPKQWLHQDETQMTDIIATVRESNLKLTLAFGIGMHHAGLHERDRKTVEELFVNCNYIEYTLAWGVNFPAHLVIAIVWSLSSGQGTENYDGKTRRYVDYTITGTGSCPVVSITVSPRIFYKRGCCFFVVVCFLIVVISLPKFPLHVGLTVVVCCPVTTAWITINKYLSNLVERSLRDLECSYCMEIGEDDCTIEALTYGRISSYYYLKHQTVRMFKERLRAELPIQDILSVLTVCLTYGELPVRHNEDQLNSELAQRLPLQANPHSYDSAHTKTHLLLQAHFSRAQLPCSDYGTDTKTVLDNAIRICQAMLDVAANGGWLVTALSICNLVQMIVQGRWLNDSSILTLPTIEQQHLYLFSRWSSKGGRGGARGFHGPIEGLPELIASCEGRENTFAAILGEELQSHQISQAWSFLSHLPVVEVRLSVKGWWKGCGEQAEHPLPAARGKTRDDRSWLDVHADQEYVLQVSLQRINTGQQRRKQDSKAQAPRFPKNKDESWFLVLGEVERRELLAVKRIGYCRHRSTISLAFYTPEKTRKCIYTLYLMSDSYLGLDQQYDLHRSVTPACIAAQVNSEVTEAMGGMSVNMMTSS